MSQHSLPRLPPVIADRLGQPIGPGDLVQYCPQYPLIYTVSDSRRDVDPRAPLGSVILTLQVSVPVRAQAGQPIPSLIKVGTLQARPSTEITPAPIGPDPSTSEPDPGPSTDQPSPQPPSTAGAGPGPRLVLTDPPST